MKFAKKIVVYPSARTDPLSEKMIELDREMSEILAKKDIAAAEKIALYNNILAKNLSIENQYRNQYADDRAPQDSFEIPKEVIKPPVKRELLKEDKRKKKSKSISKDILISLDETVIPYENEDPQRKLKDKKKNSNQPKGYNKSNKIKKQLENQLLSAWESLEESDRYQLRKRPKRLRYDGM